MSFGDSLYTASQCRQLDQVAIDEFDIPGYTLMGRAGQACLDRLLERWPQTRAISLLCGAGNNAGDGYVIARLAQAANLAVQCFWLTDPERLQGDAARAWKDWCAAGGQAQPFDGDAVFAGQVVVDALLGTGLTRAVDGAYAHAVTAINGCGLPVLSVDVPSGVCADSGRISGCAVCADLTVTFIGRKRGLHTGAALDLTGALVFADLEVPAAACERVVARCQLAAAPALSRLLPLRQRNAHKGSFGGVLVVGGNAGMAGAVRLSGEAALRSGAGLVRLATRAEHASLVAVTRPELMVVAVEDAEALSRYRAAATVVAVGPGLGTNLWARELFDAALAFDGPVVVDADGLNLLAERPQKRADWVLTPHPGEAARLLDCSSAQIQQDRFAAAAAVVDRYGGVCVLKGAGTVVCWSSDGAKSFAVCGPGNPGMATAGMGDVLTGVVAALLAQGLSAVEAGVIGVLAHACAGDAAAAGGQRGMLASDVIARLRAVLNS